MKILLSALNTRHTHSAVALGYLKAYWEKFSDVPLFIHEFDINQTNETIIASLIEEQPDILAFSTYIWSVERILTFAGAIKAAFPNTIIILGGPEVSYNSEEIINKCHNINYIIRGEGEETFKELLTSILNNKLEEPIQGVTANIASGIVRYEDRSLIKDLDEIPCPFTSNSYKPNGNFVFYEASRGCPSKCAYCLSSVQGPVRNHSIERVKQDLDWFFKSDLTQIRFADRTFNCNRKRAIEIIEYIKANNYKNINFHFEIQADFLTEDIIDLLSDAPDGMFHLEIGVQSTNPKALNTANRRYNLEVLKDRIYQLKTRTKCYLHLDVLGGLEYDTYQDFCQSLDDVYHLKPHDIQISMVKILHGTPLEKRLANKTIFAMPNPPYMILRTKWLSPSEAMLIQDMGKLAEGILNTGRFQKSIDYMVNEAFSGSAAKMLENMVRFWRENKILMFNFTPENTAKNLYRFANYYSIHPRIKSMLQHELRMVLKVPGNDILKSSEKELELQKQISFTEKVKQPEWKLPHNVRAYLQEYSPIDTNSNAPELVVYKYARNMSAKPSIEHVELTDEQSFVLYVLQNYADPYTSNKQWNTFRPDKPFPDIEKTIKELHNYELIAKKI